MLNKLKKLSCCILALCLLASLSQFGNKVMVRAQETTGIPEDVAIKTIWYPINSNGEVIQELDDGKTGEKLTIKPRVSNADNAIKEHFQKDSEGNLIFNLNNLKDPSNIQNVNKSNKFRKRCLHALSFSDQYGRVQLIAVQDRYNTHDISKIVYGSQVLNAPFEDNIEFKYEPGQDLQFYVEVENDGYSEFKLNNDSVALDIADGDDEIRGKILGHFDTNQALKYLDWEVREIKTINQISGFFQAIYLMDKATNSTLTENYLQKSFKTVPQGKYEVILPVYKEEFPFEYYKRSSYVRHRMPLKDTVHFPVEITNNSDLKAAEFTYDVAKGAEINAEKMKAFIVSEANKKNLNIEDLIIDSNYMANTSETNSYEFTAKIDGKSSVVVVRIQPHEPFKVILKHGNAGSSEQVNVGEFKYGATFGYVKEEVNKHAHRHHPGLKFKGFVLEDKSKNYADEDKVYGDLVFVEDYENSIDKNHYSETRIYNNDDQQQVTSVPVTINLSDILKKKRMSELNNVDYYTEVVDREGNYDRFTKLGLVDVLGGISIKVGENDYNLAPKQNDTKMFNQLNRYFFSFNQRASSYILSTPFVYTIVKAKESYQNNKSAKSVFENLMKSDSIVFGILKDGDNYVIPYGLYAGGQYAEYAENYLIVNDDTVELKLQFEMSSDDKIHGKFEKEDSNIITLEKGSSIINYKQSIPAYKIDEGWEIDYLEAVSEDSSSPVKLASLDELKNQTFNTNATVKIYLKESKSTNEPGNGNKKPDDNNSGGTSTPSSKLIVRFLGEGGFPVVQERWINPGDKVSRSEVADPIRAGYVFDGWYCYDKDEWKLSKPQGSDYLKPFSFDQRIYASIDIYPKWKKQAVVVPTVDDKKHVPPTSDGDACLFEAPER